MAASSKMPRRAYIRIHKQAAVPEPEHTSFTAKGGRAPYARHGVGRPENDERQRPLHSGSSPLQPLSVHSQHSQRAAPLGPAAALREPCLERALLSFLTPY